MHPEEGIMELNWYGGADALSFEEIKGRILRALRRNEPTTVYISGKHRHCKPLVLDEELGGYSAPVRFVCMPDCELDFTRSLSVSRSDGRLFFARAEGKGTLAQGDKVFRTARYPAVGYLHIARTDDKAPFSAFYFEEGEIPENLLARELWITVWPGGPGGQENWHTMTVPVREIDYKSHRIVLDKPSCLLELGAGSRYYLQNDPSFLREEGEYCIRCGEYVCIPYAGSAVVRACEYKTLLYLKGSPHRPLNGFSFEKFRLHGAAGEEFIAGEFGQYEGAVVATNTNGFTFSDGELCDCYGHGICLYGNNADAEVSGCHIYRIGHTGIYAVGHDKTDFISRGHRFSNNHIHDVGLCVGHGSGIQLLECSDTLIEHNRIHHSPRYAISVLGFVSAEFENGALRSADERRREDCARAHDITIAHNDVFRCNLDSQDTGIIQAYYAGPDVQIMGNYIHDSDIPFSFGNGIYLDDCCKKVTVAGNFVTRLQKGGGGQLSNLVTAKGTDHHIFGNIFYDNGVAKDGAAFSVMNLGNDSTLRLTCHSNAVIRSGENLYVFSNWAKGRISFSDFNLIEAPRAYVSGGYGVADISPIEMWSQRDGFDRFSIVTKNARFDGASGCFDGDSPARCLGIDDFDLYRAGLTDEYTVEKDEDEKLYLLCDGKYGKETDAKAGQILQFRCYAAGKLNIPVAVEPVFEAEGVLESLGKGIFRAKKKGVGVVRCSYDGMKTSCKVFVDDDAASVSVRASVQETEPHGSFRAAVQVSSECGRFLSPAAVRFSVRGGDAEPAPFGYKIRTRVLGSVSLLASMGKICGKQKVKVRRRVLAYVGCRIEKPVLRENEFSSYTLYGYDRKGRILKSGKTELTDASGGVVRIEGNSIQAMQTGEAEIIAAGTVRSVTVKEKAYVRVVPALLKEIACRNIDCFGRSFTDGEKLYLYSNGANIWFRKDSFTVVGNTGTAVSVVLENISPTHADTQAGVVMRSGWEAAAPCVNLRADSAGKIMVCLRRETGGEVRYAFGMQGRFPCRLSLRREGEVLRAFVGDQEVWAVPDLFAGDTVVGASLFSVNRARCAGAVFSQLKTERDI